MYKYRNGKMVKVDEPKKPDADTTAQLDARIAELEKENADLKDALKNGEKTFKMQDEQIESLTADKEKSDKYIEELKTILTDRDARIVELEAKKK